MTRKNTWSVKTIESSPIALLTILSIFLQFLTEWLFLITKPSFLNNLALHKSFLILFSVPLIPCCVALAIILLISLLAAHFKDFKVRSLLQNCLLLIPVFFFSTSILLLFDNFTNVIFHFGIRSSQGWSRFAYALIFIFVGIGIFRKVSTLNERWKNKRRIVFTSFVTALIVFIVATTLVHHGSAKRVVALSGIPGHTPARPNILLFGGDSIEAMSMSAYGYQKDTTPFIQEFIKRGLLCENAFASASQTAGSLTSLLTGKLPTQTRVLHEPDFLRDEDSYEHLPGLLKKNGYKSAQFSVRIYGDAHDLNLKSSFDSVNFRGTREQAFFEMLSTVSSQEALSFLRQTYQRVSERLMHIFYMRKMREPFSVVTDRSLTWSSDDDNMNGLLAFIRSSKEPFFAHVHLLAPHVETPEVLTNGIINLYDSRIRFIDDNFKRVINVLERSNKLNQTLIVFYSDHARRGDITKKVPLIFWFPNAKHSGRVVKNVTLLDVAPTILDFMGLPAPEWMRGTSIISEGISRCRRILAASAGPWDQKYSYVISEPPFFSLWKLTIIVCDRYYMFDLLKNEVIKEGPVSGHTGECGRCSRITKASVREFIVDHLNRSGYDTSAMNTNKGSNAKS